MQDNKFKTMKFEISKSGKSVFWEEGGASSNTGSADIICAADGNKKTALFFKRGGHLSNDKHALFIVDTGDYLIDVYQHRGDVDISILQVGDVIETDEHHVTREVVNIAHFSEEQWDIEPPEYLDTAIKTAVDKAFDYHCRNVYYGIEKPKRY